MKISKIGKVERMHEQKFSFKIKMHWHTVAYSLKYAVSILSKILNAICSMILIPIWISTVMVQLSMEFYLCMYVALLVDQVLSPYILQSLFSASGVGFL